MGVSCLVEKRALKKNLRNTGRTTAAESTIAEDLAST